MYNAKIYINGAMISDGSGIEWSAHPQFKGVFMKTLLRGVETGQQLSVHMVKIEPHCRIENHIHQGKSELHEIIEGRGFSEINQKKLEYAPGVVSFIPKDIPHNVEAGNKELILLAKFIPALT